MAKKWMTAEELMAELRKDKEFQKRRRKEEAEHRKALQELIDDEASLVADCASVGIAIKSVWDLVNTSSSYAAAIPVLTKHLEMPHLPRTIEGIVRALTTPESRGVAFDSLVKMFRKVPDDGESGLKWLLGAAIAEAAGAGDANTIIDLANDERHGHGRAFLPLGLAVAAKASVQPVLESWLSDPELSKSARKALTLLRRKKA